MPESPRYRPIADYGLIGAMHTCALVSKDGSIDWCCLPAFDSPAAFCRILDWREGGYYQVAPLDIQSVSHRYLPGTNVLETTFNTSTGSARLLDFMPVRDSSHSRVVLASPGAEGLAAGTLPPTHQLKHPRAPGFADRHDPLSRRLTEPFEIRFEEKIVRVLECVSGRLEFQVDCHPRFDYGQIVPRTVLDPGRPTYGLAHGGANAMLVYCSAPLQAVDGGFRSRGRLGAGDRVCSVVTSMSHYTTDFAAEDEWITDQRVDELLGHTVSFWEGWSAQCRGAGEYRDGVLRSALALKALTYEPTGAIVAAPTTSLPEGLGGVRNWDYRYTWIRDATFSLKALFDLELTREAAGFKDWLEWTTAYPEDLQLMYGIRGERLLPERELPLEGYFWSRPVRVGNGAANQFQLDIYGELMDSAYLYWQLTGQTIDADQDAAPSRDTRPAPPRRR